MVAARVATTGGAVQLEGHLVPYDEHLLERAHTQWQFGDWTSLIALDRATLQHHPQRGKLAMLAAAGHLQQGNMDAARELTRLAQEWGCSKKLAGQLLVGGVYNTLGRAAAVGGQEARALKYFERAVAVGAPGSEVGLITRARVGEQLSQLGLLGSSSPYSGRGMIQPLGGNASPGVGPLLIAQDVVGMIKTAKAEISAELKAVQANPYVHNRTMTAALNSSLREFLSAALGKGALKPTYIDYLALKAMEIEKTCMGRLATTVQDAVIRQVVAESIEGPHLGVLEIGALYGINLAILYNQCVTRFESTKVICLDPFDGYYGKPVDAVLNTPINPQAFHRNMRLGNVPPDAYRLIRHYSTDAAAIEAVRQERVTLLIIDGDHSYDGVKFDYENYFPFLESGGYVIFDDYDAKEWPDVKRFVDHVVKNDSSCEFIGSFSRTAIGRKRHRG